MQKFPRSVRLGVEYVLAAGRGGKKEAMDMFCCIMIVL